MKNLICILLVTLIIAGSLIGCATAEFQISSLATTPKEVVAGESLVVEVDIANIGGAEGVYTANLTMDGKVVDTRSITIAAGVTEHVSFKCCPEVAGSHTIGLGGLTTTVTALRPAEFEIGSLSLPSEVIEGEAITIEADIENTGEVEGTCPVTLKVDEVEVGTKDILVAAGDSKAVSFQLTEDDPGTYTIDLEGLTGAFRVLKPAEFKVSNLRVTPEKVKIGEEVTLEADIENTGEVEGTCPVTLKVDGVEVGTKDILVAAGDSETISFQLTEDDPGTYTIDLEGLTGEAHFRELKPAEFELGELILIDPNPVKVGEETSITIMVRNIGEAEDTYTARLVVDGQVEQTKDVTLNEKYPSKSIVFLVSKDSPGSYSVEIGDREAVLEVFEPVQLRTGTKIVKEMRYGKPYIEITENGLVEDAVIVLCRSEEPSIPLLAVYIRSGDTTTIKPIQKGTYAVYIATGRDWNDDSKKFYTDATYGQFMRATGPGELTTEFEFKQTSTEYSVWQLPLKPVPGGVWGAQFISEAAFPELKEDTVEKVAPAPAPLPPSSKLIYEDDFSNPYSGWPRFSGEDREIGYEDGEYHILVKPYNWAVCVWNRNVGRLTDFVLEIDARLVSGPEKSLYGVIFRVQDTKTENYYRFLVSGDSYYLIGTKTNDVWTILQRKTKSAFINEGKNTNHLKVVCQGSQIDFYVNGHYLTTVTDDSFAEGCVGMVVDTPEPDTLVAFDNLKVYGLE